MWTSVAGDNKTGRGGGIWFLVRGNRWNQVGEVYKANSREIGLFLKVGKKGYWLLQVHAPVDNAIKESREKFWTELRQE